MQNKIKNILLSLGICVEDSIYKYYHKVRDRDDIAVLKCRKSGIIFLSQTDHIDKFYYNNKENLNYFSSKNREEAKKMVNKDDKRRSEQFKQVVLNKKWLDFGTGGGGILDLLSPFTKETYAVEPQNNARKELKNIGYKVYTDIEEINNKFDVITLFHVLEHLTDPLQTLYLIRKKLFNGGKIIIEVPHGRDFLMLSSDFKDFTFWSEHLILHTKKSLRIFLKKAGFKNINIFGYQRYPLSNHLYWLIKGGSGGHEKWKFLDYYLINKIYCKLLKRFNKSDTLTAIAEK